MGEGRGSCSEGLGPGLKPLCFLELFSERLKARPDTNPSLLPQAVKSCLSQDNNGEGETPSGQPAGTPALHRGSRALLEPAQEALCGFQLGEELFFGAEGGGVDAAAAAVQLDGVPEVEHLVVDDVLDGVAGNGWVVEDAADDNRVVGGVVVAKEVAGAALAPAHARAGHETAEQTEVQIFEDGIEIIDFTLRRCDAFAAAHLTDEMGLLANVVAVDVFLVAGCMGTLDGL